MQLQTEILKGNRKQTQTFPVQHVILILSFNLSPRIACMAQRNDPKRSIDTTK